MARLRAGRLGRCAARTGVGRTRWRSRSNRSRSNRSRFLDEGHHHQLISIRGRLNPRGLVSVGLYFHQHGLGGLADIDARRPSVHDLATHRDLRLDGRLDLDVEGDRFGRGLHHGNRVGMA